MMDTETRACTQCGADISHRHRNARYCEPCRDGDPARAAAEGDSDGQTV